MFDLQSQVLLSDLLIVLTMVSTWRLLRAVLGEGSASWISLMMPATALLSGMAWKFWPTLAEMRLLPAPKGQAAGISLLVILLVSPLLFSSVRNNLKRANWEPLARFSYWRVVYGSVLIVLGVQGGLPAAFFWSAGVGDIMAGIWGLSIAGRGIASRSAEFKVWNLFALADLVHVLVLGALYLRPFFIANPEIPPVTLLPLTGVPVMIALHICAGTAIYRRTEPVRA